MHQLKVFSAVEANVENVKIFFGQAHTPEAIGAVREIAREDDVRAVGAVFAVYAIGTGIERL